MKRALYFITFVIALCLGGAVMPLVAKAEGPCLCTTEFGTTNYAAECYNVDQNTCAALTQSSDPTYSRFVKGTCSWKTDAQTCLNERDRLIKNNAAALQSSANDVGDGQFHLIDKQKFGACGGNGSVVGTSCGDISIFVELLFQVTDWLFGIIGALALLMFVYGGFMFILSQGNAERVQQGKGIFTAAVIGLVVAFGGYVLVKFIATAIGVDSTFILK